MAVFLVVFMPKNYQKVDSISISARAANFGQRLNQNM